MSSQRRLKALRLIQKLRDQEVDEIGAKMAGLRNRQAELEQLSKNIQDQSLVALAQPAGAQMPFTAQYLREASRLQRVVAGEMASLDAEADALKATLGEAYAQAKTNEVVLDATSQALKQAQARRETEEMSEIAATRHIRRMRGD